MPLKQDPCIFQHHVHKVIIAVYVDDLIATAKSSKSIEAVILRVGERFKMRSLGDISFYLGCRIIRNREYRKLCLTQDAYVKQLLEKYHMQDAKPVSTPLETNTKLQQASDSYRAKSNLLQEYQSLVGGLMWPAMQTRADATSQLAKHMNNPTEYHLDAGKRVLRYLKGTPYSGILMVGTDTESPHIEEYTDASYADDRDTARSTGG